MFRSAASFTFRPALPLPTSRPPAVRDSQPGAPGMLPSDADLVQRIKAGDTNALGEVYDRYASLALATARRVLGDPAAAEDVVHDAFVGMWRRMSQFDADRGSLRSWLLTMVRNRAIDRIRARRPQLDLDQADELALLRSEAATTADEAMKRIATGDVRAAVDRLPSEQRRAVELAYFEGYTYREIASITGVPEGTASGRLRLALSKLRGALVGSEAAPEYVARLEQSGGHR